MKRLAYIAMLALLAAMLLVTGCAQSKTTSERGTIKSIDTGENSITITTEEGKEATLDVTGETQLILEGRQCSLEDLAAAEADADYSCTIIYDSETGEVLYGDFYKVPEPASEKGTLADVGDTSITITTQGDKDITLGITPETQFLFEGKVCTLEELQASEEGIDQLYCTVIYNAGEKEAQIVDVYKEDY